MRSINQRAPSMSLSNAQTMASASHPTTSGLARAALAAICASPHLALTVPKPLVRDAMVASNVAALNSDTAHSSVGVVDRFGDLALERLVGAGVFPQGGGYL